MMHAPRRKEGRKEGISFALMGMFFQYWLAVEPVIGSCKTNFKRKKRHGFRILWLAVLERGNVETLLLVGWVY